MTTSFSFDVFLSHNKDDKVRVRRLAERLRVTGLRVWFDEWVIKPGDDIYLVVERGLETSRTLVLCLSSEALGSDWVGLERSTVLFRDPSNKGRRFIPLLLTDCDLPDALRRYKYVDFRQEAATAFEELLSACQPKGEAPQSLEPQWKPVAGVSQVPQIALGRLPTPGPVFVGRKEEIARLDAAWDNPAIHVISLVAFGGVGKSALVAHWLDRMSAAGWRGAERVFDWSFYSQGTENQVTSAEPFIDAALRFCGDPDPSTGSPYDRGVRLAGLIRQQRTLLILDGVEPLQYPPGPLAGKLKDPGLAALLKGLAASNPGLCVVTTRERIADLNSSERTAPQVPLEELSPGDSVELLRQLGVDGRESELWEAVEELGHHALTLTLLGNYLKKAHGGDVRKRQEVELEKADKRQGGHAFRVIAAYARWLGEGPELAILRLLGLFDRPADEASLAALRAEPVIPGLTESLVGLAPEDWRYAVETLREHGLLAATETRDLSTLNAHPLVRVYLAEDLEQRRPEAWKEGNRRLYDYLRKSVKKFPDTLNEMQPLYAAVVHGCRAGQAQGALNEVYWRRIQRGKKLYSTRKLGAIGLELTALTGFFDLPWSQPSARLTQEEQALLLNEAGLHLRALGRLREAVDPISKSLDASISLGKWAEPQVMRVI